MANLSIFRSTNVWMCRQLRETNADDCAICCRSWTERATNHSHLCKTHYSWLRYRAIHRVLGRKWGLLPWRKLQSGHHLSCCKWDKKRHRLVLSRQYQPSAWGLSITRCCMQFDWWPTSHLFLNSFLHPWVPLLQQLHKWYAACKYLVPWQKMQNTSDINSALTTFLRV